MRLPFIPRELKNLKEPHPWIFRTVVKTITRLSVWAAAALRLQSLAAVRLVTG